MKERLFHETYQYDVYSLEKSVIMFIHFKEIFECISQSLKKRAEQILSFMRSLSCFEDF
jgi:hypothetical protein